MHWKEAILKTVIYWGLDTTDSEVGDSRYTQQMLKKVATISVSRDWDLSLRLSFSRYTYEYYNVDLDQVNECVIYKTKS